ncbi:TolC family protein, partial [Gammaproteobacteria bacterium]|nr:TolC family protein [Gammaproteobacteria bacterium]
MRINGALVGLSSLWVVACGGYNPGQVDAESRQAARDSLPAVSNAWLAAEAQGEIEVGWIETFGDAQLIALVEEAQAHNPDLKIAAANVLRAQALARQSGAELSPDINLALGAASDGNSLDSNAQASAGLQIGWEADLWGRLGSGVAQATASAQSAEADYRFASYSLAANTALAYFNAIEAQRQTQIARDSLDVLTDTQRVVSAQYQEGMASAQDLALTRADLAVSNDRVIEFEGAARDSLRALELILGRYPA